MSAHPITLTRPGQGAPPTRPASPHRRRAVTASQLASTPSTAEQSEPQDRFEVALVKPRLTTPAPTTVMVALSYLRRGFCPIPQEPGAKKPAVLWKPFQNEQPRMSVVVRWFTQGFSDCGIALVLGPAFGLFVIDCDGPEAHEALVEHLGGPPMAPMVLSGSGKPCKYHLYFKHPAVATNARFTPWHRQLEFRGYRGIVIAPPSVHPSGNCYRWAEGRSLDDMPLPEVPAPVLAALRAKAEGPCRPVVRKVTGRPRHCDPVYPALSERSLPKRGPVIAGPSHCELDSDTAERLAKAGVCRATLQYLEGAYAEGPDWNGRLFAAAADLHGCGIDDEEAEALLLAGAEPWDGDEEEAARRTIASAFGQDRVPARVLAAKNAGGKTWVSSNGRRFAVGIPVAMRKP